MVSAKIISFFSTKEKVGKTFSCANIAFALGKMKFKTLIIDMDPIANLSHCLLKENIKFSSNIITNCDINKIIVKKIFTNVDLIPTSLDLGFYFNDLDITNNIFKDNLKKLSAMYDVILIDMSSNWNSLNKMILSNSNSIILPINFISFSVDSISNTLNIIKEVKLNFNPNIKIEGVFINMFEKNKPNSINFLSEINKIFGNDLYDTIIPNDSAIEKLYKDNKIILNNSSQSSLKFNELAKEIYKKIKVG